VKRSPLHNRQPKQGPAATMSWRPAYACAPTVLLVAETPEFRGDIDCAGGSNLPWRPLSG
jgi:hypothetical protein